MYKYQCSKHNCSTTWTLREGSINGFVLTCPVCLKGRGLFVEQLKRDIAGQEEAGVDEMNITIRHGSDKSIENVSSSIDEFVKRYSVTVLEKKVESADNKIICSLKYKIR